MSATFPMDRTGTRSKYKKPKVRKQESAARIKRLRAALGLTQEQLGKKLTELAIAKGQANVTGVWTVAAWEKAKREPDATRLALIEELERGVGRDGATGKERSSLA